jgi:hypothetical protein
VHIVTQTEHRLGVSEVNLVIRHLKLREANADAVTRAMGEIDNIHGMDHVSFEHESQVLNIAYDATRTCIDCIEEILERYQVQVSDDWWTRFKEGYYRYIDQNVKDNATHEPFSCHKVPPHK